MRKISKKILIFTSLSIVLILVASQVFAVVNIFSAAYLNRNYGNQKNVILLIPDGMSSTHTTISRWYKGAPLALDEMASGLVRTYWAGGIITDSAPAGTALATGKKTTDKFIGVLPDSVTIPGLPQINPNDVRKPIATVLEAAKIFGKSTGLVATSNIQHATPSAFSSHFPDRSKYEILGEQQVYNNIDVVLGAGSKYLLSTERKDKEDLIQVLRNKNYDLISTPTDMTNSTKSKIWGMFAPDSMAYDMDRDPSAEPSLAEMTKKAIDVLSKDKDGFFLMVEGSKVDWASHANDPIGVISDVLAFDEAVKVALNFAKSNKNTVVLACTDHGNGGMTIGSANTNSSYSKAGLDMFLAPLKRAKLTGEGIEKKLNADRSNIKEVMSEYYGISDLTTEEEAAVKSAAPGSMNYVVGPMMSKRANIGWTTTGHTGEDVVLYSYADKLKERLVGTIENTDIATYIAHVMGFNLDKISSILYVDAKQAFEAKGAVVVLNNTNVNNPVLEVTKGNVVLKLPANKSIADLNGKIIELDGVTVYNDIKVYISQKAVDLIRK